MNPARKFVWIAMLIAFSQLVAACGGEDNLAVNPGREQEAQSGPGYIPPRPETYPVDPLFLDFYHYLGGEDRLGPAISAGSGPLGRRQQYVQAGLMLYDSQAPESERFSLAPLGKGFSPAGNGEVIPAPGFPDTASYYPVHAGFKEYYESLGGARFVGPALGEARYNPEKARWEQYFENLGFYRLDGDGDKQVRLMAYGASACDFRCRYHPPADSIPSRVGTLPEPFAGRAKALGEAFTGSLLSGPRLAVDGRQEVIFENLVLVVDRANPAGVTARPLPEAVGIQPGALVPPKMDPLMVFYPLKGELGHNVPELFKTYLVQHGGLEVSGLPTGEIFQVEPGLYRQCFTNLCLDFNLNEPAGMQIHPAPFGEQYLGRAAEQGFSFAESQSLENIDLQIWEGRTFVSSEETQEVHVAVFDEGQPLKNREPVINLTLPDGNTLSYHFPPTGEDGLASFRLPAIPASSGTLVAYQVCLKGLPGEQACMGENFMIWNHP